MSYCSPARVHRGVVDHNSAISPVELRYTCRAANAGAVIRLQASDVIGADHAEARAKTCESELLGRKENRVQRGEGFEQNWGTMRLGDITLKSGTGTLTLRAMSIPGDAAIDFRLLLLRRMPDAE